MPTAATRRSVERSIEIKPDDRELLLGTFDVPPSRDAEQGRFRDHHRVRRDPAAGGPEFVFRRIRSRPLRGMAREAADVAFSPDGKLLATAHAYNADPGDVKLWDMATGAKVATLPIADRGVVSVAFSPDGTILAGRAYALADPRSSWEIILWDVASRRELRRFGGKAGRISALAFAPDGRTVATIGADRAVRLWDVANGREDRRIDGAGSGWAMGFSPDGQSLVMTGAGRRLILWDVPGKRLRAVLEPEAERFAVYSIAFAPDGRTLAAAGSTVDAKGAEQQGQVRLYDLAREPIGRRAVLTFDRGWLFGRPGRLDVQRRRVHARRPSGRGGRDAADHPLGRGDRDRAGRLRAGHFRRIRPPRRLARRPMAGGYLAVRGRRLHPRHHPAGAMRAPRHDPAQSDPPGWQAPPCEAPTGWSRPSSTVLTVGFRTDGAGTPKSRGNLTRIGGCVVGAAETPALDEFAPAKPVAVPLRMMFRADPFRPRPGRRRARDGWGPPVASSGPE